ncbi:MAG: ATP-binding protein [Spirochaetota bacterium]
MKPRISVITGHYGSGKSEISVNLALSEARRNHRVALVDLDVVNPYFRSREKRELLEGSGVRVIANSFGQDQGVDIPAVSPEVFAPLQDPEARAILDTGGDPVGARLLGTYRYYLQGEETEVLCVCNVARPETQTAEAIVDQIRGIEAASRLRVTGLINNTHMLEHTTVDYVERGNEVCRRVSELLDIPVRYVAVLAALAPDIPGHVAGELIPIAMHLREAWMYA